MGIVFHFIAGALAATRPDAAAIIQQGSGVFPTYPVVSGMWLMGLTRTVCRHGHAT